MHNKRKNYGKNMKILKKVRQLEKSILKNQKVLDKF